MANKNLFSGATRGATAPKTNTCNKAGGVAYLDTSKAALAQLATTGTLNDTVHTKATEQLSAAKKHLDAVSPTFIGQLALYARNAGYMKDMPALLVAYLSTRGDEGRAVMKQVFPFVINNGKMVRNFVQIMRSGVLGRKSLGNAPKNLVRQWLESKSDDAIFRATVGNDPSLADIIKMVHPKATTPQRNALYGYIIGRKYDVDALPGLAKSYEDWKAGGGAGTPPAVDFRQLASFKLSAQQWGQIAHDGGWHMVRMNLNTFHRHGVFDIKGMDDTIAKKLADPEIIRKSMVFPYQLLIAYLTAEANIPHKVREGLQDALEAAVANVPSYGDGTAVLVDNSGSMGGPITGYRGGATSAVQCSQVAGLIAASVMRNNKDGKVILFADGASEAKFNPRDSVLTNAKKFGTNGGGTNISSAFQILNKKKHKGNLVILVSDMETWADSGCAHNHSYGWGYAARSGAQGTGAQQEWNAYKARNPDAKLVTVNLVANTGYSQFQDKDRNDILKIGGFSDTMWDVITNYVLGNTGAEHWLKTIESVNLNELGTKSVT